MTESYPGPVQTFEDWYIGYGEDPRHGCLEFRDVAPCAQHIWRMYQEFKTEMDMRVSSYHLLEKLGDGEVISPKADLPNISSGETAGMIRRIARNLVQNTPNVEVISRVNDDSMKGVFVRHILLSKIIGSDEYSNDMQQNLFASAKTSLTLGFNCVIPVLQQDAGGSWYMKYDTIHYRDVFPEPGVKDIRQAPVVFIRRYLTEGDVRTLLNTNAHGWDHLALKRMLLTKPNNREAQSVDHQTAKRKVTPKGYEIITMYTNDGRPFLTFEAREKMLLRIERNKHPLKQHPVHFLVLEKDENQPLGKSQIELLVGRQDFQDLMLNGAMKLWYRNINPSIIGYGTVNSIPNLSPGKYTQISNPNAKVEAFEVNTGTLMQFSQISQQNLGSMVNLLGAADQQMATQAGNGMSATPQGVEAQQAMVDITTNNYQKAIESFFSHYCSYALTMYFQELKALKSVTPTAETRLKLLQLGLDERNIGADGTISIDFEELAKEEYFVRCVPGSLVEMEDEKQMRILNELFIPLSQAMPALANAGDPQALNQASAAMQYIIRKQIELSGSSSAQALNMILGGEGDEVTQRDQRIAELEERVNGLGIQDESEKTELISAIAQLQQQMSQQTQLNQLLLEKLGVQNAAPTPTTSTSGETSSEVVESAPTVQPVSA